MNKRILFIIIGIVLLIGAALTYVVLAPKNDKVMSEITTNSSEPTDESSDNNVVATSEPGAYRDYSQEDVLQTEGVKLLFFHAPWCPQCRAMEASIEKDGLPSGVTVFKIDYDSNQDLRQKYGVTIQTTFVKVDDEGNKIASYVAYEDPQFSTVERALLK